MIANKYIFLSNTIQLKRLLQLYINIFRVACLIFNSQAFPSRTLFNIIIETCLVGRTITFNLSKPATRSCNRQTFHPAGRKESRSYFICETDFHNIEIK